jgi:hypothetical protein
VLFGQEKMEILHITAAALCIMRYAKKGLIMKITKNEQVQKYLEEMMMFDTEKYDILQILRGSVFRQYPKVNERMMYGGIMFSLEDDFGGVL